eukprot:CAMPEP_0182608074 /NCGR_PEP_ID=MMETSP1330-20130603/2597_1 /TAXON_ID=464278 /ORGANISM="Picochlorum sp., Strain RCC944" /LENGTH=566 /DNA_ID=CAMNT_0024826775 /DNA_START=328 /DNA_END=2028 /DNA_ORIENTATION=+
MSEASTVVIEGREANAKGNVEACGGGDGDGGRRFQTPETSEFLGNVYNAVVLAGRCVGNDAVQFPGRDRILQVMKNMGKDAQADSKKSNKTGGRRSNPSQFGIWRSAMEFLKERGLIHAKPNSGTFVSTEVGSIGDLLALLEKGIDLDEIQMAGGKPHAGKPQQFGGRPSLAAEEESSETDDETIVSSSEEEIAAEILSELKNCSEIPPQSSSKRRAKKSSSSSKRGPRSASSAAQKYVSVAPVGFELKGPWQPQNDQEEGEYTNFLNKLVSSNNNITYWTHSRLKKSVAAIFGVLHQAPFGLPRIELRNYARAFVGDTGLLDYTIKVLVNMELCGFFMKRETNPESGKLLYYVEYVDEERKREHQAFRSQAVVVEKKENVDPTGVPAAHAAPPQRSTGKRKVSSPKRFEDYKSTINTMKPPKKRYIAPPAPVAAAAAAAAAVPVVSKKVAAPASPLPPPLGEGYVRRQERVNEAQGKLIVGSDKVVSCQKEVNNFVTSAIKQFRQQIDTIQVEHNRQPFSKTSTEDKQMTWVNKCVQGEILREITGVYHDMNQVREQLKQIDTLG